MKLVTLDLQAPGDGTAVFIFPERTRRYRLMSVFTTFTTLAADANVFAMLSIYDTASGLLGVFPSEGLGGSVLSVLATFSSAGNGILRGLGGNPNDGTNILTGGNLPQDIWMNAQTQLRLTLANATPGGGSGGGTTWGGSIRAVILE